MANSDSRVETNMEGEKDTTRTEAKPSTNAECLERMPSKEEARENVADHGVEATQRGAEQKVSQLEVIQEQSQLKQL